MSEASSEDLMPAQEAGMAHEGEESAKKKEKKSKGLANMFSVFTKGKKKKKKKDQPRLSDPEVQPKSRPESDGPLLTGRLWP